MISIGFYISKDSLSVAELSLSGSQPKILSLNEFFFKDSESEEEKHSLLSKELERIEREYKGKNIRFCCSLSQSLVSSFFVEFPFKEKFKILKTIPFEIEDKTPFQLDKVCFDARICRIKDKSKSSVLVFVTPEESVKEFVSFVKPLKRNIHLLSCSSSALANLLEAWQTSLSKRQNPDPEDSAYVYLGLESSLVLLYKDGFLNHVSALDWGWQGIIEEMRTAYKLSREKAFQEFFTKAFILTQVKGFTKEQKFFSNLIKKKMQTLAPEIKLLKLSLETTQNQTLSKIVIFGPGSMIKNLSVFLTEELALPVSKLKGFLPFSNFDLQSNPLTDVALGLALEGLKKSPYTGLNFLQSSKKTAFSFFPIKWKKTVLVFLFCFVIFSVYAFMRQFESAGVLSHVDEVFSDYGAKIAYLKKNEVSVESVKSFLASEKEKKEDEKNVMELLKSKQPMDQLQFISQKIGSAEKWSLKLQFLKITDEKIEIKGQIKSLALESFKSLLQSLSEKPIEESKPSQPPSSKERIKDSAEDSNINSAQKTAKAENKENFKTDSTVKEPTQKEIELSSFSYSFTLKKGL